MPDALLWLLQAALIVALGVGQVALLEWVDARIQNGAE